MIKSMSILKSKKIQPPPSRVADLKSEKKNLERHILEKETELIKLSETIKKKSWNLSHMEPARHKAGDIAIASLRGNSDLLLEELTEMRADLKVITNSLAIATREENEDLAVKGEGEIAAKLAVLVEKLEAAYTANVEYYKLRKSFKNPGRSWPYSCDQLDRYKIDHWLKDAKRFIEKD